jgi:hypothetical protein
MLLFQILHERILFGLIWRLLSLCKDSRHPKIAKNDARIEIYGLLYLNDRLKTQPEFLKLLWLQIKALKKMCYERARNNAQCTLFESNTLLCRVAHSKMLSQNLANEMLRKMQDAEPRHELPLLLVDELH